MELYPTQFFALSSRIRDRLLARDFSATLDKLNVIKAVIHKIEGVGPTRCILKRANNGRADLIKSVSSASL